MELDFDSLNWSSMMVDSYNIKPKQDLRKLFPGVFNFKEYYEELHEVDITKFLRFIPMCYDKNSPLRQHFTEINRLKIKAADLAGFVRQEDGKFLSNVEEVLAGSNEIANRMIIRYVIQHKNSLYTRFVMYQELYENEMQKLRSGEKGVAKISEFDTLGDRLDEIRQELFSQDNNVKLQQDFTQFYFEDKLLLRPEDIAEKLRKGEIPVSPPEKKKFEKQPSQKILDEYAQEDEYVVINEDPDLHPIYIKLPKCEDPTQAEGYGIRAKDQIFKPVKWPNKLEHLLNTVEKIEEVWATLSANQAEYKKEIRWIEDQWYYSLNGYWFYNNGKLTYLDGWHYNFLNFWKIAGTINPEYRDRDRKWYHGIRYAYTTSEYPLKDDKGKLVYKDEVKKVLKMQDAKRRVFLGYADPKGRRAGDSNKHLCAQYMETITHFGIISGIVSSSGGHAKDKLFDEILVSSWQKQAFFFRPMTSSNENPNTEINFSASRKRADNSKMQLQLKSKIDHSPTATASYYDGGKVFWMLVDESGKCFGENTEIRMYDGSVKFVQDIKSGDIVMGDDSTPRIVSNIMSGNNELFEIIPNKGKGFVCNGAHTLTISVSDKTYIDGKKYVAGDIINISVYDYLKIKPRYFKNFTIYKKGWELKEKQHEIPPYLLGLWLGDGNSADTGITTTDQEVLDYIKKFANTNGLKILESGIVYGIHCKRTWSVKGTHNNIYYEFESKKDAANYFGFSGKFEETRIYKNGQWELTNNTKNVFLTFLQKNNLIKNKHIPIDFILDSRENRLELLAGLLDTDGHAVKGTNGHRYFEITQKIKSLSSQIQELATSLGYYVSMVEKTASMKREDGSYYYCKVYRVCIYGDIDLIPTKVSYKKAIVSRTKNRRNPLKTGFKINSIGNGNYYGFEVDKNSLFLLKDGTVVHNCKDIDVYERHQQLKQCVAQGAGINIFGFMGLPSTVGEMEGAGGRGYYNICKDSFFEKRNISGQTTTGLMLLYISCLEGLEGFVDKYGNSVIDTPTPEQAKFINKTYGAREYINSTRAALLLDPKDTDKYNEFVRQNPILFKECFRTTDGDIGFNTKILNERIDEIAINEHAWIRTGDFYWTGEPFNSRVDFRDSPNGKWKVSQLLPPNVSSKFNWAIINGEPQRVPFNPKHVTCCDPYKQEKTQSGRMSDLGIATAYDYDPSVDANKEPKYWQSYRLVCTYKGRPGSTDDQYEDVLLQSIYYNSWIYPEINVAEIIPFMTKKGFAGYFLYDFDWKTGKLRVTPGFNSQGEKKQNLFNTTRNYISVHGHKEKHADFLQECKDISSMEEMTDYDLFTAGSGALMGCSSVMAQEQKTKNETVKKPNMFKKRKYS